MSSAPTKRALIVVRLSKVTDATTSPERQLEICNDLCRERGYEVVGVAEDLDVSGSVDPFDRKKRPRLSRWLANEEQPFDVIVAYRVDRLTRSIRHLQELVNWASDNDKLVVSATESHFDMTTPWAAVMIALMGTVAQMELEAISERSASAKRRDIRLGKYRGGTPPWGYMPERDEEEVWRLVRDPEQVNVIREVVERVLDGEPLQRIAHDLTLRGVPTPKDRALQLQGKPTKGTAWNVTPMRRSLLSEAMLGRVADANGNAIRAEDGSPILRAGEPIMKPEEFERVRAELAARSKRGEPNKRTSSLLLRVIYCGMPCSHKESGAACPDDCTGTCGGVDKHGSWVPSPAYMFNGGSHSQFPRYRCRTMTTAHKCGNRTIRADDLEKLVDHIVRFLLGDSERLERVWDSGSDNSAELDEVNAMLTDLTSVLGTGHYKAGTPQRAELDRRIAELSVRQDRLAAEVVRPSGWTWKPTGERFGDWWDRQDIEGRNIWLRSMNTRVVFDRRHTNIDAGDITEMARQVDPAGIVAGMLDTFKTMSENGMAGVELSGDEMVFVGHDGQRHEAQARRPD